MPKQNIEDGMPADAQEAGVPSSDFMHNDEMEGNFPPMEQEPETNEAFDTGFDAEVEADENEDPKKYIQQLTGKLCTTLNKYNEDKPQPDSELCKYVAGMVMAQCTKGLDEKQRDEILKKLTEKEEVEDKEQPEKEEVKEIETEKEAETEVQSEPEMNEEKMVERIVNDIVASKKMSKPIGKAGYKNSPFVTK